MIACIVQARMGSTRFPGKVLANLAGKPVLQHVLERCKQIKGVDVVVCAMPFNSADQLYDTVLDSGALVYMDAGDEDDVLNRYADAAYGCKADIIMRITADCPLIDPDVCGEVLAAHHQGDMQYTSNVYPKRTYPQGFDCEVFTMEALTRAAKEATEPYDREHVTPWMQRNCGITSVYNNYDASHVRWTVDYPEDIARLEQMMREAA